MGNPIKLPENFSSYDFEAMAKAETHPAHKIRLIAMANIQEGKTLTTIADMLKVNWKTVQTWLANFRKKGINGLYNQPKSGAPRKLDQSIEQWIIDFLTALNNTSVGGQMTVVQLHRMLEEKFSISCTLRTVYNTVHRLNFSWVTARSIHPKSDIEAQEQYKKLSSIAETIDTKND